MSTATESQAISRPTRECVAELLAEGCNSAEIARRLGLVKSTVAYHVRQAGRAADARFRRRYDWLAIQAYYDEGHSLTDCQNRFGCARKTLMDAAARGALRTRPPGMPIDRLLGLDVRRNRCHVKQRLVQAGLLEGRCERCGIQEWQGKPLSLALHHRNGAPNDNRLENLALLCPNCHSQTDNFAGRNRRASAA